MLALRGQSNWCILLPRGAERCFAFARVKTIAGSGRRVFVLFGGKIKLILKVLPCWQMRQVVLLWWMRLTA